MSYNTTSTSVFVVGSRKPPGWCKANGVEHAWEVQNYVLTSYPPQSVRKCLNCGLTQTRPNTFTQPEWQDC